MHSPRKNPAYFASSMKSAVSVYRPIKILADTAIKITKPGYTEAPMSFLRCSLCRISFLRKYVIADCKSPFFSASRTKEIYTSSNRILSQVLNALEKILPFSSAE